MVPYFQNQAQREPFRVVIVDGVVKQASPPNLPLNDGAWFFVMDSAGNFYFFEKDGDSPVHHSSFFAGGPIASGGNLKLSGGRIVALGYYTGHYLMNPSILENARRALSDAGVDVDSLQDLGKKF